MATEVLPIGMPWTMKANQVYALPPVAVTVYSDAAAPVLAQSTTVEFTPNTAVTFTENVANPTGAFLRATADTPVVIKRK